MAVWLNIHPKSKACLTKGWSNIEYRGVDPDKPGRTWLGLRLDGLVIADCDCQEALDWWLDHIGVSKKAFPKHTYTVRTNHGWHLFYVHTPGSPDASIIGRVHQKLDIKAGRGALVVTPPSPGYEELYDNDLKPFDPRWIPSLTRADGSIEFNEIPDGQGNPALFSIACKLRQMGFTVPIIEECLQAINPILMRRDPMRTDKVELIAQSAGRYETSPDWPLDNGR